MPVVADSDDQWGDVPHAAQLRCALVQRYPASLAAGGHVALPFLTRLLVQYSSQSQAPAVAASIAQILVKAFTLPTSAGLSAEELEAKNQEVVQQWLACYHAFQQSAVACLDQIEPTFQGTYLHNLNHLLLDALIAFAKSLLIKGQNNRMVWRQDLVAVLDSFTTNQDLSVSQRALMTSVM
eukprot:TRINITY_DN662_c0_g2_i1.p1 TRINITY_DN662_c0_g2~~TRINITY_DN662_c0_g2_i1.p1  ORF type:complete len:181 (-),score=75.02 TRINITY_DN662_c0_g2_i1:105-647(-)